MPWELIHEETTDLGWEYRGKAELCVFEFKLLPEQVPGMGRVAILLSNAFARVLPEHGGGLLRIRVWEDTSPALWTNYRTEVVSVASPLIWKAIVAGALTVAFLVALTFTIREVRKLVWDLGEMAPVVIGAGLGLLILLLLIFARREKKSA